MNKYTKIIIGIIVVVLIVIAIQSRKSETGAIKIGAIIPATGFASLIGEDIQKGMNMAVEELNSKGIEVEVIFENSAGLPVNAVSSAKKLIDIDKVDAIHVDLTGPGSAVSPIALQANIPLIYNGIDGTLIEKNPFMVKVFVNVSNECGYFAKYSKDNGIKKVAYIGPKADYVMQCVTALKDVLGSDNVISEEVSSPAVVDFRTEIIKTKQWGAEAIVTMMYEQGSNALLKQKTDLNYTVPVFCIKTDCLSKKITDSVPASGLRNNVVFDFEYDEDFMNKVYSKYPNTTNAEKSMIATGYDSVMYMVNAIEKCGKGKPECVIENITKSDYKSVIKSNGFGDDRMFDPITTHEVVE